MNAALLDCRDTFYGWFRGDAASLSDRQISQTINLARITLIVGLVFLHYQAYPNSTSSPFDGLDVAHHPVATFINSLVLFFFFSAVPLLSMISGWLFFSFQDENAGPSLRRRMRRRISSLYLPLVSWNALFFGMLLVWFSQQPDHPIFEAINIDFGSAGWLDYLNAVFAVTERPIGFQFWFIRDLFVTVLVSPLLWLALRHAPYFGMAMLGAVWLMGSGMFIFFRPDVVFFFYLGGFLRMYRVPLDIGLRPTVVLFALYVGLIALRALAPMFLDFSHPRPELLTLATRLTRLVGVLACWGVLLQLSPTRLGAALARYGGLTFFLYAAHFPLLAGVKILLWHWVPAETDGWMIAHYVSSVTVTVAIALSGALLLARVVPNWFSLMNGGRLAFGESRKILPVGVSALGGDPVAGGTLR